MPAAQSSAKPALVRFVWPAASRGRSRAAPLLLQLWPQQLVAVLTPAHVHPAQFKEFQIYRWSPESPEKPHYVSYKVDINRCARAGMLLLLLCMCVQDTCVLCA